MFLAAPQATQGLRQHLKSDYVADLFGAMFAIFR